MPAVALIGLAFVVIATVAAFRVRTFRVRKGEPWLDVLGRAFDSAPAAQLITAADGTVVQSNIAFARLFAGASGGSLDQIERAAASPESAAAFRSLRERAQAGLTASACVALQLVDSGRLRHFEMTVEPGAVGHPTYQLWTIQGVGALLPSSGAVAEEPCAANQELLDPASIGRRAERPDVLAISPGPAMPAGGSSNRIDLTTDIKACNRDACDATTTRDLGEPGAEAARGDVSCPPPARPPGAAADLRTLLCSQRFFADAPIGIAVVDRLGRFIVANRALGELLDVAEESLIGRGLVDLVSSESGTGIAAALAATAAGSADSVPAEVWVGARTMRLLLNPLTGFEDRQHAPFPGSVPSPAILSGAPPRKAPAEAFAVYFTDVTEQKHRETQLAQSVKMQALGQLAGGIAHDFNNLLTAMIGFCDLLLLRSRPGDPAFPDIMQIKQNANRAANLVRQLLAFSRQQNLQPRVLDITDVLTELSDLLRRLIGENIELEFDHGRDLGLVKADQGQLEQVIINLAVNARDAMPEGGKLIIRTANSVQERAVRQGTETMPAGSYVLVEVTDTGIGIAADQLARIFEPFFSTKEVGSGTGLGLSTVYGIVKQTGGFVFVDSTPGQGTRFSLHLPRCAREHEARLEAADPAVPRDLTGHGTIMLVEDDDAVRMFSARALRNKGYQVLEARSGEAALKLVRNAMERVDLVITDVVMPQMDGPAMVHELRAIDPMAKVIFISGYAEDAFRQRLDSERDIHFLAKPFNLKQLALKVKEVMPAGTVQSKISIASANKKGT